MCRINTRELCEALFLEYAGKFRGVDGVFYVSLKVNASAFLDWQVAFLAAMVGPRVAASAAQSALMALSGVKPAANLANRNCLVLDLPEFDWSKPGPDPSK